MNRSQRNFQEKVENVPKEKNVPRKSWLHFGDVQHWGTSTFDLPKIIGQSQRIHWLPEVCALRALRKMLTYCWWVRRMWKRVSYGLKRQNQVWQPFAYALTAKRHDRCASAYLTGNTSGNLELHFASQAYFSTFTTLLFFFLKHLIFSFFPVKKQLSCYEWGEKIKSILILQFAASAKKNWIAFVCSKLSSNLWPAGWYCEGENGAVSLSFFYFFYSTPHCFFYQFPPETLKVLVLHHNTW